MARDRNQHVRGGRSAFTLIEILIVIVILGIIATIVIPQFSNASDQAKENTLKDELRYLRTQIVVYAAQHKDVAPGLSGTFVNQMTLYTDEDGNTNASATAVYKYGPYLSKMPKNPINGLDTVEIVASGGTLSADGTHGWEYKPSTKDIIADAAGNDTNGTPYGSY